MKITMDMVEKELVKKTVTPFRVGDQLKVVLKIIEGDSERLQTFEGTVIRMRGQGASKSFTVRKVSYGVGVERTLPLYSPRIEKIEVVRSGHVRRAKLYFLRERTGRAARLDEKVDRRDDTSKAGVAVESVPPIVATPAPH